MLNEWSYNPDDLERACELPEIKGITNNLILNSAQFASSLSLIPGENSNVAILEDLKGEYEISAENFPLVVARFKIMAELDHAEHVLPQSGSFELHAHDQTLSVTVASYNTEWGEALNIEALRVPKHKVQE